LSIETIGRFLSSTPKLLSIIDPQRFLTPGNEDFPIRLLRKLLSFLQVTEEEGRTTP
jgi:hypothetical protein